MSRAYLVLEDGKAFEGVSFGAEGEAVGEVVFTVGGMCGYLETLSDPAFAGQIVVQTFPLIGNYGTIEEDLESNCFPAAYIVRECCEEPSNFRCEGRLSELLKAKGVVALHSVDTRALTAYIRKNGVVNAKVCKEIPADTAEIKAHSRKIALADVSTGGKQILPEGEQRFNITVIDCGIKKSIIEQLVRFGCNVTVVDCNTPAGLIKATRPDGLVIGGGPEGAYGCETVIEDIRYLIGSLPMLGIGLGHQLMAVAMGGTLTKMSVGHRGAQTVKNSETGECYTTAQNHGLEVVEGTVNGAKAFMVNLNDGSIEGLEYVGKRAFSVQFYPEVYGAPRDGSFVYRRLFDLIRGV
ncbi:MAG: carbamoyl phosphate synthase small subunit [Clostridia bacterium]|nr:carbamoyl phosphate synthase small subunit [Clostridia bacterium]